MVQGKRSGFTDRDLKQRRWVTDASIGPLDFTGGFIYRF